MDSTDLLLAYHVRALAMQLLAKRAPANASADELAKYQRDYYEAMVHHIMSDLEYTAEIIADCTPK